MKCIKRTDLLIVLEALGPEERTYDLHDLETLLDVFGDDYFIEGGRWEKTKENVDMTALRSTFLKGEL